MAQIGSKTLIMAIQAVESARAEYRAELESAKGADARDVEEILVSYDEAADELRKAYLAECAVSHGLPPYERLVRKLV